MVRQCILDKAFTTDLNLLGHDTVDNCVIGTIKVYGLRGLIRLSYNFTRLLHMHGK